MTPDGDAAKAHACPQLFEMIIENKRLQNNCKRNDELGPRHEADLKRRHLGQIERDVASRVTTVGLFFLKSDLAPSKKRSRGKTDSDFKNSDSYLGICVAIANVVSSQPTGNEKRHPTLLPSSVTWIEGIYGFRNGNDVVLRCEEGVSRRPQRHNSCGKMFQNSGKAIHSS